MITEASCFVCDLAPDTPRFDATQQFVTQETIFVELLE